MPSRVLVAFCALLVFAACARKRSPPAEAPTPAAPAPAPGGISMTETVELRRVTRGAVPDTGAMGAARRASIARAQAAARLVDTIVATPDTIELEAGESVLFFNALRLTARDSTGATIEGLAPRFSVADQNIVRFERGELVGVSVGRTVVRVEPAIPGAPRGARPRTRTEIPVVVRPARTERPSAPVDSVPRDLVVALLGNGIRPVSLRVGALADGLSESVFRDGRIMGSAHVGNSATTAVIMPFSARVVLDTIEARLEAEGWTRPRPPRPMTGFLPAQQGLAGFGPGQACRNGEHLGTVVRARAPNETLVVISQQRVSSPFGPCGDSTGVRRSLPDDYPVPLLYGPGDAELQARGSGGGGDYWETRALLRGRTPLDEVLQHFAAQLRKQEWVATDSSATRNLAMQTFRMVRSDGKRWLGILSIIAPDDADARQLSFRLIRLEQ
jgi:hypothetical protein